MRLTTLHTIALLEEAEIHDDDAAIETYRAALEIDDADPHALEALARLYARRERWQDLSELTRRRAEQTALPEDEAKYRLELGKILENKLGDGAAYEWLWNGQAAHIGATFMQATVNPTLSGRSSSGLSGRDSYTDYSLDAGYQFLGERDVISIYGIYVLEKQSLAGTITTANAANSTSFGNSYTLSHSRLSASYWYQNTYGISAAWQKTWGPANPSVFAANPVFGSANGKPDTNAFLFEADWVPFGKGDSWGTPLANLKLGLQYIMYTKFNGGTSNYDGAGRNAAANNTIFAFAWLAF